MNNPRFLQVHTLHSYTAALLNRDDTGQAKRLLYGGTSRTRISSQCLKRHWRMAKNDPNAIQNIPGFEPAFRSRELVTEKVIQPLRGNYDDSIVDAIEPLFQRFVYGDKADKGKKSRQTLLLGKPEIDWLAAQAASIARNAKNANEAQTRANELRTSANYKTMTKGAQLPGGLVGALFGRMVTSDPAANIDAPVHVAHAFTVHAAETEGDYFTAVDDLKVDNDFIGADTIQETELTCGLFYGYVVIDLPGLIQNCGSDKRIASAATKSLIHLIAEVSPGAKRGSTAPYGRADLMLIEAGDRQPRSLSRAFRQEISNNFSIARDALRAQLQGFDSTYNTGEERRYICVDGNLNGVEAKKLNLGALADWASGVVEQAPDE